jgi:hypothetical protein
MPETLLWAIPSFIAWAALQIAAIQFCTDCRDEKAKYGFGALVLLVWWLPNLAVGETGASGVEQLVLLAGFPVAAIYLAGLLIDEWIERRRIGRKTQSWRLNAESCFTRRE